MKKILHVSCSPRGHAAESYRLSQRIIECLVRREPAAVLIRREIGNGTLGHIDEDYAVSQASLQDVSREGSMAQSEELIRELESADFVVIATPMHNLTVPSALKAWIDHVVRARRTFDITPAGKIGTVSDRPVFFAISSGGRFSGARARQPDFLTPYLKFIMGTIGLLNLTFFSVQGTAGGPEAVAKARGQADVALRQYFLRAYLESDSVAHESLTLG